MNLNELTEKTNQIPQEQRQAILAIIEYKIDNDMKEVIAKIDAQNQKFDAQNQKFDNVKNEIKIVYWVVGFGLSMIVIVLSILAFKK